MAYGTLVTLDTLAASQGTVADFGEDNAWSAVESHLTAHNAIMSDIISPLVFRTTERLIRYGGLDQMQMDELDEMAQPDAQKITAGVTLGFPLRMYGASLQWTRKYFQNAPASQLAANITAMTSADVRAINRELKRAIFRPTNYTFVDRLVDHVDIPVKALVNADGAPIPLGPNGEEFNAATHTHYLARAGAGLVQADVTGAIDHVVEHYASGQVYLYINRAQEAAVRAFADFHPYLDARLTNQTAGVVAGGTLNMNNVQNRAIGVLGAAEVWVKPWIPVDYLFAFIEGANRKPLAYRTRAGGGLELVADDERHPLRARSYEREFGVSVLERTAAAALYAGGTTYVQPNLSA